MKLITKIPLFLLLYSTFPLPSIHCADHRKAPKKHYPKTKLEYQLTLQERAGAEAVITDAPADEASDSSDKPLFDMPDQNTSPEPEPLQHTRPVNPTPISAAGHPFGSSGSEVNSDSDPGSGYARPSKTTFRVGRSSRQGYERAPGEDDERADNPVSTSTGILACLIYIISCCSGK